MRELLDEEKKERFVGFVISAAGELFVGVRKNISVRYRSEDF